jgi:Mitochondrial K+-H+ exchange-related
MRDPMDVFVIPVGRDRYELYCEQPLEVDTGSPEQSQGLIARWRDRFLEMLRTAEERRGQHQPTEEPKGWLGRVQDRLMSWVVERIAEQRLLWNLRGQSAVVAVHPDDVEFDVVLAHIKRALQRDFERHRNWLVVDVLGLLVSAALTLVPGPNLLAYYFLFRVGGHFFSMRGARQGQYRIAWTGRPCPPLRELRDVTALPGSVREQRIRDVASRLRLRHLSTFFERVAIRPA